MQYKAPYTYFVSKPGGTTNLLYGSLVGLSGMFVPIVGQVVWLGYQAEVAEDLERDPETLAHPDFTFDRFTEYLGRGAWVFLMNLLIGAFSAMLGMVAVASGLAVAYLRNDLTWYFIVAGVLVVPLTAISALLTWPLILHVQLSGKFRFGAATRFTSRFLAKLWGQLLVTLFIHTLISMAILFAGMLAFCVGLFPAAVIVTMAQEHYMIQLYRVYLAEGGEPIGGPAERAEYDED